MSDLSVFPGPMPGTGTLSVINESSLLALVTEEQQVVYDRVAPIIGHLSSQGSGSSITALLRSDQSSELNDDAILKNSDQWVRSGSDSNDGNQVTLVRSATGTTHRHATCASDKYVPPQSGFTVMVLVKLGASVTGNTGIVGKVHSNYVTTRGFGIAFDGTGDNIIGWVGDKSDSHQVASVGTPGTLSEYLLAALRYTEDDNLTHTGTLKLSVLSSEGLSEDEINGVDGSTLGLSAGSYSSLFLGAIPKDQGGANPGSSTMDGAFVWDLFWGAPAFDEVLSAIQDKVFKAFTIPRKTVVNLELVETMPVGVGAEAVETTRFSMYIGEFYNPGNPHHRAIMDFPGTPFNRLPGNVERVNRQEWADNIMGGSSTGTSEENYSAYNYGGLGWPELADAVGRPLMVVIPWDYYNGDPSLLGDGNLINNTMLRRRALQVRAHLEAIGNNSDPVVPTDRRYWVHTGWSAGGSFVVLMGVWHPELASRIVDIRSAFGDGGSMSSLNLYFNTYGGNEYDYTEAISGTFGDSLDDYTDGVGPLITTPNGQTIDWVNNAPAKTVQFLVVTGQTEAGDVQVAVDADIALMRAQSYDIRNYYDDNAGHAKSRELVVRFAYDGFDGFFSDTSRTLVPMTPVFGWGDSVPIHPQPHFMGG